MAKTSYLVTGATGATGGATARQLLAKGYRVRALAHRRDERSDRHDTSHLLTHLREVAIDHHNRIGGREPMTIGQFVQQHRAAFE
jgi:nucleoside-diphosphate-sugar epimerase